jgi:hypothetical protein
MIRKFGERLCSSIGNRQSPIGNAGQFCLRLCRVVALVAIFFARREDFAHGGTGILPVRTAKMAVPRLGWGPAALYR